MRGSARFSTLAATGLSLAMLTAPANALLIEFDDILTGPTVDSILGGDGNDYLTANVANGSGGVNITLDLFVDYPSEFVTALYFSLNTALPAGQTDPSTTPDIDLDVCKSNASSPANTGPYQLCMSFAPSDHAAQPYSATFFISGLTESNFVANASGWFAVAHIQGIEPDCSSWVGAYNGTGSVAPGGGGVCVSVPEPATISLLGLGFATMLGAGVVNSRRRRSSVV